MRSPTTPTKAQASPAATSTAAAASTLAAKGSGIGARCYAPAAPSFNVPADSSGPRRASLSAAGASGACSYLSSSRSLSPLKVAVICGCCGQVIPDLFPRHHRAKPTFDVQGLAPIGVTTNQLHNRY